MSFTHFKPAPSLESKASAPSEYEITILNAVIDKNGHLKIDYEVNKNIEYHFICITNSDGPTFNGKDFQHELGTPSKGCFHFKPQDFFPFDTARICIYSRDGMRWGAPTGGKLLGKSALIKDCLSDQLVIAPPGGKLDIISANKR
jgi:hypothetical protein